MAPTDKDVALQQEKRANLPKEGESLRAALQQRYSIEAHEDKGLFGDSYRGFATRTGSGAQRPVFIRLLRREDGFAGLAQQAQQSLQSPHPSILAPREVVECPEVGTAFIFDAPATGVLSLRQFISAMHQDPTEEVVGVLFAPVVMGLFDLEQKGMLPAAALVDSTTVLTFADGSVRALSPFASLHGAHDHHRHRKLESHQKTIEKREAKQQGHQDAATLGTEKKQLSERFINADLGMILYEIMFRKETHKVSTKMIRDAKNLHKNAGKNAKARFSPELSELLLELLQNGKTEKNEVLSLQQIVGRPVMQRFIQNLGAEVRTNRDLSAADKQAFIKAARPASNVAVSYPPAKMGQYDKERDKMVRGKHHKLSALRTKPIEKRHGIRFDIPLERTATKKRHLQKRYLHRKSKRAPARTREDYAKARKMFVSGKHHHLSKLKKKPIEKKNGIRFDIPLETAGHEKHHAHRLLGLHMHHHKQATKRSRDRTAAFYEKRRAKMVLGKHHKLSKLIKKPIEKKNGIRFDIPLEDSASKKRRVHRKSRRAPARTREDYAKDRKKYVAGKHHKLSKLKKKPIEKRGGVRFDIPLEISKRHQRYHATRPATRDYIADRRRLITGEGHRLAPFVAAPIEKKRSMRFDIAMPQQQRAVRQTNPAEQPLMRQAKRRVARPKPMVAQSSWFDTYERRRVWSSKRRAPLSIDDQMEAQKLFGLGERGTMRNADERKINARGNDKAWWETSDRFAAKTGASGAETADRELMTQPGSSSRLGHQRAELSAADQAEYDRAFGRHGGMSGDAAIRGSASEQQTWWQKGDVEEQQNGPRQFGAQRKHTGEGDMALRAKLARENAERPIMKQAGGAAQTTGRFMPRQRSAEEQGEYERAFGSKPQGNDAVIQAKGGEQAWWEKSGQEQPQIAISEQQSVLQQQPQQFQQQQQQQQVIGNSHVVPVKVTPVPTPVETKSKKSIRG